MKFETNVFINCPFDPEYINDLLKPMIYIIVKNGFAPRLSLEISDSGEVRLQKITNIIRDCKYSIHDISIVKAKKVGEFARMNMPFELGIDYGLRNSDIAKLKSKQFLILEATKYHYMKAISDINGFDIKVHRNKTQKIFDCLHAWFSETVKIKKQAPPLKIFYEFLEFNTSLFEEKRIELKSEKLATNYIETISITEYIDEIKERL